MHVLSNVEANNGMSIDTVIDRCDITWHAHTYTVNKLNIFSCINTTVSIMIDPFSIVSWIHTECSTALTISAFIYKKKKVAMFQ